MKHISLNGWQRLGIVLSVFWFLSTIVFVALNHHSANVFDVFDINNCDYSANPFYEWYDKKSEQPVETVALERTPPMPADPAHHLPGGFTNCTDMQKTVNDGMAKGAITPVLHLQLTKVLTFMFLPLAIFWLIAYIVVYTAKWVLIGFRRSP